MIEGHPTTSPHVDFAEFTADALGDVDGTLQLRQRGAQHVSVEGRLRKGTQQNVTVAPGLMASLLRVATGTQHLDTLLAAGGQVAERRHMIKLTLFEFSYATAGVAAVILRRGNLALFEVGQGGALQPQEPPEDPLHQARHTLATVTNFQTMVTAKSLEKILHIPGITRPAVHHNLDGPIGVNLEAVIGSQSVGQLCDLTRRQHGEARAPTALEELPADRVDVVGVIMPSIKFAGPRLPEDDRVTLKFIGEANPLRPRGLGEVHLSHNTATLVHHHVRTHDSKCNSTTMRGAGRRSVYMHEGPAHHHVAGAPEDVLTQLDDLVGRDADLSPHGDVLTQDALKLKPVHREGCRKLTSNAIVTELEGFRYEILRV